VAERIAHHPSGERSTSRVGQRSRTHPALGSVARCISSDSCSPEPALLTLAKSARLRKRYERVKSELKALAVEQGLLER
jgi:hypothetical protein